MSATGGEGGCSLTKGGRKLRGRRGRLILILEALAGAEGVGLAVNLATVFLLGFGETGGVTGGGGGSGAGAALIDLGRSNLTGFGAGLSAEAREILRAVLRGAGCFFGGSLALRLFFVEVGVSLEGAEDFLFTGLSEETALPGLAAGTERDGDDAGAAPFPLGPVPVFFFFIPCHA